MLNVTQSDGDHQPVEMLACEGEHACVSTNCTAWFRAGGTRRSALCNYGYNGVLCSECAAGFTKVDRKCMLCPQWNFRPWIELIVVNVIFATVLLHKSTQMTVSDDEIVDVWNKIDENRRGFLHVNNGEMNSVLELCGQYLPKEQQKNKEYFAEVYGADKMGRDLILNKDAVELADFQRVQSLKSPTAMLSIFVFFFQTYGLVGRGGISVLANTLNIDIESTAETCLAPMSYAERWFFRVIASPLILALAVLLCAVPLWSFLRRRRCLNSEYQCCGNRVKCPSLWGYLQSPEKITKNHLKRTFWNIYLFIFAPVTRAAVEALACTSPCENKDRCTHAERLTFDMSVECYTPEHTRIATAALMVLFVMVILLPALLLRNVTLARKRRDVSLTLRLEHADKWFGELDVDNSQSLDLLELARLLKRMARNPPPISIDTIKTGDKMHLVGAEESVEILGTVGSDKVEVRSHNGQSAIYFITELEHPDLHAGFDIATERRGDAIKQLLCYCKTLDVAVQELMREMDVDGDGKVSRAEFQRWYREQAKQLTETPYDFMFQLTRKHWWFLWSLMMRALINILYTFGRAGTIRWQVWFHLLLGVSLGLLVHQKPYLDRHDHELELASTLCLVGLSHMSSLFVSQQYPHHSSSLDALF